MPRKSGRVWQSQETCKSAVKSKATDLSSSTDSDDILSDECSVNRISFTLSGSSVPTASQKAAVAREISRAAAKKNSVGYLSDTDDEGIEYATFVEETPLPDQKQRTRSQIHYNIPGQIIEETPDLNQRSESQTNSNHLSPVPARDLRDIGETHNTILVGQQSQWVDIQSFKLSERRIQMLEDILKEQKIRFEHYVKQQNDLLKKIETDLVNYQSRLTASETLNHTLRKRIEKFEEQKWLQKYENLLASIQATQSNPIQTAKSNPIQTAMITFENLDKDQLQNMLIDEPDAKHITKQNMLIDEPDAKHITKEQNLNKPEYLRRESCEEENLLGRSKHTKKMSKRYIENTTQSNSTKNTTQSNSIKAKDTLLKKTKRAISIRNNSLHNKESFKENYKSESVQLTKTVKILSKSTSNKMLSPIRNSEENTNLSNQMFSPIRNSEENTINNKKICKTKLEENTINNKKICKTKSSCQISSPKNIEVSTWNCTKCTYMNNVFFHHSVQFQFLFSYLIQILFFHHLVQFQFLFSYLIQILYCVLVPNKF